MWKSVLIGARLSNAGSQAARTLDCDLNVGGQSARLDCFVLLRGSDMRLIIEHTAAGGVYAYLEKESHFRKNQPLRLETSERRAVKTLDDDCTLDAGTHVVVRVDKRLAYSDR